MKFFVPFQQGSFFSVFESIIILKEMFSPVPSHNNCKKHRAEGFEHWTSYIHGKDFVD